MRMSRTYFSRKRAEAFAKALKAQGITAQIWSEKDYLNKGGTLYYVKWDI